MYFFLPPLWLFFSVVLSFVFFWRVLWIHGFNIKSANRKFWGGLKPGPKYWFPRFDCLPMWRWSAPGPSQPQLMWGQHQGRPTRVQTNKSRKRVSLVVGGIIETKPNPNPQNPRSRIWNQNSKIQTPKIKLQDPNPQNQNSKIQNQNSKIQNQSSKIQNQNSKIQNQSSRIQSRNQGNSRGLNRYQTQRLKCFLDNVRPYQGQPPGSSCSDPKLLKLSGQNELYEVSKTAFAKKVPRNRLWVQNSSSIATNTFSERADWILCLVSSLSSKCIDPYW